MGAYNPSSKSTCNLLRGLRGLREEIRGLRITVLIGVISTLNLQAGSSRLGRSGQLRLILGTSSDDCGLTRARSC